MKRILILGLVNLAMLFGSSTAEAGWGSLGYGGYQPWWNIFAPRNKGLSPEEERLQRFWHDYYDSLRRYYDLLDNIDWVAYYKNHGYQINNGPGGGCGPCGGTNRTMFAPVFVSPTMQWAVPNAGLSGPPMNPSCPNPAWFQGAGMGGMGPGMGGGMAYNPYGYPSWPQ